MCTNISYGQPPYLISSASPPRPSLSRSKSSATARPVSLIGPSAASSPVVHSTSAVFLQSALQCFYHHLTPDTLILPQSYLVPPPVSSTYQLHQAHYHQHLQQYYHQLMLSIQQQSHSSQKDSLISSAAALLLDRIANGTTHAKGTPPEDLMSRSMPSAAHLELLGQLCSHSTGSSSAHPIGHDCSSEHCHSAASLPPGNASSADNDRLAVTKGGSGSRSPPTRSIGAKAVKRKTSSGRRNAKQPNVDCQCATSGSSGSTGSYVTELVAKFEQQCSGASSTATAVGCSCTGVAALNNKAFQRKVDSRQSVRSTPAKTIHNRNCNPSGQPTAKQPLTSTAGNSAHYPEKCHSDKITGLSHNVRLMNRPDSLTVSETDESAAVAATSTAETQPHKGSSSSAVDSETMPAASATSHRHGDTCLMSAKLTLSSPARQPAAKSSPTMTPTGAKCALKSKIPTAISRPTHNCCCCCCVQCSSAPNSLLGVNISQLCASAKRKKCAKKGQEPAKMTDPEKDANCDILTALDQPPSSAISPGKSKSKSALKSSSGTAGAPPAETNLSTSPSSSNSDNSSTDEGIDNPEDVVLDDDEEDVVTLGHSHHEHHHNHHYQHHRRVRHLSGDSCSKNSSSAASNSGATESTTLDEDIDQVERYLNGTNAKHLSDLCSEEANLLKEIADLEREQLLAGKSKTAAAATPKVPGAPTETNLDLDDDDEPTEEDDEELLEFQQIEREIKLSELRKCLQTIQKRIEHCRKQIKNEEELKSIPRPISSALEYANMTDSMIEECRQDAAAVLNFDEDETKPRAPLATSDEWDTESQLSNTFTTPVAKPPVAPKPKQRNLHFSDSDDSDDEPEVPAATAAPKTPPRKESLQSETSTLVGTEAIIFDCAEFYRQSLHEDALHESIEQSLQQVNSVSDADEEQFVIAKPPIAPKTEEQHAPVPPPRSGASILRRESQYENENPHKCDVTHRRGYERIQAANRKLQNGSDTGEKSQSLDDLLKPEKDVDDDEMALRRRSAKFPTEAEQQSTGSQVSFRKRNSESSNTVNTNGQSQSSLSSNTHRPLTLYLPSPNEELNLITHLHQLGHDLTSSIVTNNLLITPFTCSGYLYKQCAGSSSKWRKRYFHFNRVRKVFVYFHDRTSFEKRRHPKRGVFFDEIQDVYVDHTRMKSKKFFGTNGHVSPSHLSHVTLHSPSHGSKHDGTRCVFVVSTTTMNRKFILSTFSPELMRIWMDVIFTGANAYLQDFEYEAV